MPDEEYAMVAQRDLNLFCLEARTGGINCWDKDVKPSAPFQKEWKTKQYVKYRSVFVLPMTPSTRR